MFTTLALSLLLTGGIEGQPMPSRLAVIRLAPDFELIDHDAKPVKLSDYKGKVCLVSFIFTTCNGSCPATTHRMSLIVEAAKAREEANLKTFGAKPKMYPMAFFSITLDPARDKPEALRQYSSLYGLELKRDALRKYQTLTAGKPFKNITSWFRWSFITGEPAAVNKTVSDWGMWVKPLENGQLDHPSRIFLLDQEQRIREIYNVELLRPEEVLDDVRLLLDEGSGKK